MSVFIPVGDTAPSNDGYAIAQAYAFINSTIYNSVLFWVLSAEPFVIVFYTSSSKGIYAQTIILAICSFLYVIQIIEESSSAFNNVVQSPLGIARSKSTWLNTIACRMAGLIQLLIKRGEVVFEAVCWIFLYRKPGVAALRCFRVFRLLYYHRIDVCKRWVETFKRIEFCYIGAALEHLDMETVLESAVESLRALAVEMFYPARGGLILMLILFYTAFLMGVALWIETGKELSACGTWGSCMFTMLRLTFYDGNGFDYLYSLSVNHKFMFFLVIVYMCGTAFGILNGLVGLFGAAVATSSNAVFERRQRIRDAFYASVDDDDDDDENGDEAEKKSGGGDVVASIQVVSDGGANLKGGQRGGGDAGQSGRSNADQWGLPPAGEVDSQGRDDAGDRGAGAADATTEVGGGSEARAGIEIRGNEDPSTEQRREGDADTKLSGLGGRKAPPKPAKPPKHPIVRENSSSRGSKGGFGGGSRPPSQRGFLGIVRSTDGNPRDSFESSAGSANVRHSYGLGHGYTHGHDHRHNNTHPLEPVWDVLAKILEGQERINSKLEEMSRRLDSMGELMRQEGYRPTEGHGHGQIQGQTRLVKSEGGHEDLAVRGAMFRGGRVVAVPSVSTSATESHPPAGPRTGASAIEELKIDWASVEEIEDDSTSTRGPPNLFVVDESNFHSMESSASSSPRGIAASEVELTLSARRPPIIAPLDVPNEATVKPAGGTGGRGLAGQGYSTVSESISNSTKVDGGLQVAVELGGVYRSHSSSGRVRDSSSPLSSAKSPPSSSSPPSPPLPPSSTATAAQATPDLLTRQQASYVAAAGLLTSRAVAATNAEAAESVGAADATTTAAPPAAAAAAATVSSDSTNGGGDNDGGGGGGGVEPAGHDDTEAASSPGVTSRLKPGTPSPKRPANYPPAHR